MLAVVFKPTKCCNNHSRIGNALWIIGESNQESSLCSHCGHIIEKDDYFLYESEGTTWAIEKDRVKIIPRDIDDVNRELRELKTEENDYFCP